MESVPLRHEAWVIELAAVGFRRNGRDILDAVDLRVREGEHWALLGPNGAGKSTILSFCGALAHPTSGTVDVLGHRLGRVELQALRRRIGHVNPRHPIRSSLTIREVVTTGLTGTIETVLRWDPEPHQLERIEQLMVEFGLAGKEHEKWPTLSQGERGRALIARSLVADPPLLLLDEPATGLDIGAREQLLEQVDRLSRERPDLTSVVVTHHLEELPTTTTHVALVRDGVVVAAGDVDAVLTTEHVSRAFDHPIEVSRERGRWAARSGAAALV